MRLHVVGLRPLERMHTVFAGQSSAADGCEVLKTVYDALVGSLSLIASIAMGVEVEAMRPCRAAVVGDGVRAANATGLRVRWEFRLGADPPAEWPWLQRGAPPLNRLAPMRQPRSSEHHRHVPVTTYSMTNRDFVSLESGLEHDLVRRLDRDRRVLRIVPQPFTLSWSGSQQGRHTPDIMSVHSEDAPTVWDVRASEKHDADFTVASAITGTACARAGWRYEVFAGMDDTERLNMLWLHGFRRTPPWADRLGEQIRAAAGADGATLGTVFACDDGSGELISAVWHLVWRGVLHIDMTAPWDRGTAVMLGVGYADD